jgi:hypothetical protein
MRCVSTPVAIENGDSYRRYLGRSGPAATRDAMRAVKVTKERRILCCAVYVWLRGLDWF